MVFALLISVQPTKAETMQLGIAAVVNESVITTDDVYKRMNLTKVFAGLQGVPDIEKKLLPQTLRSMVDEELQRQEAERLSIMVSPREIQSAIAPIEQAQGLSGSELQQKMEADGISFESFKKQVESQIRWQKLLQTRVRRDVAISQDEVKLAQQKMQQGRSELEWKVSTISLPVNNPDEESAVQELAISLAEAWQKGQTIEELQEQVAEELEVTFEEAAWVQPSKLRKEEAFALSNMKVGMVSPPRRVFAGYEILRMEDKRTVAVKPTNAEVAMKEIFLKVAEDARNDEVEVLLDIARNIRQGPGTCRDKGIAGIEDFEDLDMAIEYVRTEYNQLNETVYPLVAALRVGEVSEPFATPEGIRLLMLCEKIEKPLPLPEEGWVRDQLMQEKLSLAAAKFMRNLRRQAFVDVRLK